MPPKTPAAMAKSAKFGKKTGSTTPAGPPTMAKCDFLEFLVAATNKVQYNIDKAFWDGATQDVLQATDYVAVQEHKKMHLYVVNLALNSTPPGSRVYTYPAVMQLHCIELVIAEDMTPFKMPELGLQTSDTSALMTKLMAELLRHQSHGVFEMVMPQASSCGHHW
ncbi:hypothetical protein GGF32_007078 [Allomyces javanicus]|nr:hypothetical protein GGF32_007078 [Allomyces javanicus]